MSRAWLIVALLWVVGGLNYLDRVMITTMRGSIVDAIPMTDAQFGLLTSVFLWVYGLLSPFAGFLADRFSRSRVVLGSLFVWSAVTWMTAHARSFEELLAARALMGISEAAYIPAAMALIMDYHRGHTRSLANGVHLSGIMVGAGLGGLGGWLAEKHAWTYPFTVFGLIGIGYSIALALLLRDAPREGLREDAPPERMGLVAALRSLLRRGSFLLLLAFWGLFGLAGWAVVGWAPTYLGEHFKLGQGVAGLSATGYLQTAGLVGVLLGGAWADRWSRTNYRARILVPAIGLCIAAPAIFMLAKTPVLAVALTALVVYGVGRCFTDSNLMPVLCMISDPRCRATGYGVLNMFSCFVGGASIYLGGALRDAHVNVGVLFQIAAGTLLICATLLYLVKPGQPGSAIRRSEPEKNSDRISEEKL